MATQFRIIHAGDTIGYCFARNAETAIKAFRLAHLIPIEIHLMAEAV